MMNVIHVMYMQGRLLAGDPIVLTGDMAARARFGTSVVNLGDVNDDGYEGDCVCLSVCVCV